MMAAAGNGSTASDLQGRTHIRPDPALIFNPLLRQSPRSATPGPKATADITDKRWLRRGSGRLEAAEEPAWPPVPMEPSSSSTFHPPGTWRGGEQPARRGRGAAGCEDDGSVVTAGPVRRIPLRHPTGHLRESNATALLQPPQASSAPAAGGRLHRVPEGKTTVAAFSTPQQDGHLLRN